MDELDPRRYQAEITARNVLNVVNTYKRAIGVAETPVPDAGVASERLNGVIDGVLRAWDNPDETPEQNHQQWMDSMLARGWTLGNLDEANKTHPALVPYAELPALYLVNDLLFLNVVQANKPVEISVTPIIAPVVSPDMTVVQTHTDDPTQADQIAAIQSTTEDNSVDSAPEQTETPVQDANAQAVAETPVGETPPATIDGVEQSAPLPVAEAPAVNPDGTPAQA